MISFTNKIAEQLAQLEEMEKEIYKYDETTFEWAAYNIMIARTQARIELLKELRNEKKEGEDFDV